MVSYSNGGLSHAGEHTLYPVFGPEPFLLWTSKASRLIMCSHTELAFMADPPSLSAEAANLSPAKPPLRLLSALLSRRRVGKINWGELLELQRLEGRLFWWFRGELVCSPPSELCGSPQDPQRPSLEWLEPGVAIKRNVSLCLIHRLSPSAPPQPHPPSSGLLSTIGLEATGSGNLHRPTRNSPLIIGFKGVLHSRVHSVQSF